MKRGLLQELANNATAMACGYRPYGELSRLAGMSGSVVILDLMTGSTSMDGEPMATSLRVGREIVSWFHEQLAQQRVPPGLIDSAWLTIRPQVVADGHLILACETTIHAGSKPQHASDEIRWDRRDVAHG